MSETDDWRPKLEAITDPIAEDRLSLKGRDGSRAEVHIVIGRPAPTADGQDYYCPIQADVFFKGIQPIFGVGPVDSLINAMVLLRRYVRYYEGLSNEPPEPPGGDDTI